MNENGYAEFAQILEHHSLPLEFFHNLIVLDTNEADPVSGST